MHYYKHNIGDYRRDTAHLTLLEHGVYRQLIDLYYLQESAIPNETEWVMRRLCARTDEEQNAVHSVLSDFFELTENGYVHGRCDKELAEYGEKKVTNKVNGQLGGRPKKTQSVISENQEESESKANETLTINHKPLTINHNKETTKTKKSHSAKPDDVSDSVWADFLQIRKAKRAPLTNTAMSAIAAEAQIAGINLQTALEHCCARGWQGFKAEWLQNAKAAQPGKAETTYQRSMRERWEEATGKRTLDESNVIDITPMQNNTARIA
jgi:uncharacterized protein YdaU (DUF1376 family)